jgi:hypothetical protein
MRSICLILEEERRSSDLVDCKTKQKNAYFLLNIYIRDKRWDKASRDMEIGCMGYKK